MAMDAENGRTPLITVAIPVYNGADTLQTAIDSVLGQAYGNVELVIVDDASTDDTPAIIDAAAAADGRVVAVHHEENRKLLEARRSCVRAARGEWMLFLDADDYLERDVCAQLAAALGERSVDILHFSVKPEYENPVDAQVVEGDTRYFTPEAGLAFGQDIIHRIYDQRRGPWCVWGKVYSKELLDRAFGRMRPAALQEGEDGFTFFAIAHEAQSYQALPEITGYHHRIELGMSGEVRVSEGSIPGLEMLCVKRRAVDELAAFLEAHRAWDDFRGDYERLKKQYADDSVGYLVTRVPEGQKVQAFDLLMEYWDGADALETFLRRGEGEARESIDIINASETAKRIDEARGGVVMLLDDDDPNRARLVALAKANGDAGWAVPVVAEGGLRTGLPAQELLTVAAPELYYHRLRRLIDILDRHDAGVLIVPNAQDYPYCWDCTIARLEGCHVVESPQVANHELEALADSPQQAAQRLAAALR